MWRAQSDAQRLQLQSAFSLTSEPRQQRASFELIDEDLDALKDRINSLRLARGLANNTQTPCDGSRSLPANLDELQAYDDWRKQYPSMLQHFDDFTALLKGKRLAVFLDYDGTLTPIVSNPDAALLSSQMREVVRHVANLFPVAIISGRGREKVENFVQLKELYYAGSHGMDIAGPKGIAGMHDTAFQPAAQFKPLIDNVYSELCEKLKGIEGSSVEHNIFCVSAHFRNCPGETWQEVVTIVEEIVSRNEELRMTRGRKVVEVRPKVNWHKGTALNHLMEALGLKSKPDVLAIYIGDDHTDEDAFRALKEGNQGFGVLVSSKVKPTEAKYTVRDPHEVQDFLKRLVHWGNTENNGWQSRGCKSWLGFKEEANGTAAHCHK